MYIALVNHTHRQTAANTVTLLGFLGESDAASKSPRGGYVGISTAQRSPNSCGEESLFGDASKGRPSMPGLEST